MARRTLPAALRESQLTMSLNGGRPVKLHYVELDIERDHIPISFGKTERPLVGGILRVTPLEAGSLTGVDLFAPVRIEIFDSGEPKLDAYFAFNKVVPGGVGRRGYIEFHLDDRNLRGD